jgi:hypothetical protein
MVAMLFKLCLSLLVLVLVTGILVADSADNLSAKILAPDLAQQLLGGTIEPAPKNSRADIKVGDTVLSQCSYSMRGDALTPMSLSLLVRRARNAEEAKTIFLASKKTFSGENVGDLGDAAYRTVAPAQLNVLKGRNWLIISAGFFPKPDPSLQMKTAREILKNIPE